MNLLGETVNATCKVLGHGATFNSFDTNPLQSLGESVNIMDIMRRHVSNYEQNVSNNLKHLLLDEVIVAIQFATVF